jgi:oxygen-independent coproporphyrinogen-3 oxidase
MHRSHDAERPSRAMALLREAGFDNVSIDLIYGIPAVLDRRWEADLEAALRLAPRHLSLYGLTVEPATPLGRWVMRGDAVPAPEGTVADEYLVAHRSLVAAGWNHYEVSNASEPGFESRHNQAYWRRRSYLGLGPSAHSAHRERRWWNIREWAGYQRAQARSAPTVTGEEVLSPEQAALERLYLGLRTRVGVPASSLPSGLLSRWEAAGWAESDGTQAKLTVEGWLRLDALVRQAGMP